ncbi:MAG: flagellar biosynthetic protein FliR [Gammaproteobacteria bacterium]
MVFTGTELITLIGSFVLPLFRIAAMVMSAPIFGAKNVSVRARLIISLAIAILVSPMLPPFSVPYEIGYEIVLIVMHQILIGITLGFAVQIVFSAVITGGQIIAMQMALGFSLMIDPQNGNQVPVLSQLYVIIVILMYLILNGHIVLIQILVDSFKTIPISTSGLVPEDMWTIARWGSFIFSGAVGLALPAIASLLVVNMAFGVMARSAPQLNILSIGFPITMLMGFFVILFTLPNVISSTDNMFNKAYLLLRSITGS